MTQELEERARHMKARAAEAVAVPYGDPVARFKRLPSGVREEIRAAAELHCCDPLALICAGRGNIHLTRARATVARALRRSGFSFPVIGRWMSLNHTSVLYLVQSFEASFVEADHSEVQCPDLSGEWAI